jgi:hypothetical protein
MQRARLMPTTGIGSEKEAEQRATSALLAVMTIVRDFSVALLSPIGASKARKATVEAFTEVEVKLPSGVKVRPDGLVRVSYGSTTWSALVEVKTGDSLLEAAPASRWGRGRPIGGRGLASRAGKLHPRPRCSVTAQGQ